MTKAERAALERLVALTKAPAVPHRLRHKLRSRDFNMGWKRSHQNLASGIRFVLTANHLALNAYAFPHQAECT